MGIASAQVFKRAVLAPASQISGTIHTVAGGFSIGIGDKSGGGQSRLIQVSARESVAGYIEFAGHSWRQRFQRCVEHVNAQVRNAPADGTAGHLGVLWRQCMVGHMDCGLRDAVHVDQPTGLAVRAIPRLKPARVQSLSPKDDYTRGECLIFKGKELIEGGRSLVQNGDTMLYEQLEKFFR